MRDLKKEAKWEKQNYKRYQYRCPKQKANIFDEKLQSQNLTFTAWIKQQITDFLKADI